MSTEAPSKSLFHSELVRRSPVDVTIKGEPTPSKFKGKPDVVSVFDHEDDRERWYNVENDDIGDELAKYKGERITIIATGRDKDAWIEVLESGEPEERPSRGSSRSERRPERPERTEEPRRSSREQPEERAERPPRAEPKPRTKEDQVEALRRAFVYGKKVKNLMLALMPLADEIAFESKATFGREFSTDEYWKCLATLVIEVKGHTNIDALPTDFPEPKKPKEPKQKPAPEPPRKEPPPREPEPEPVNTPEIDEPEIPW